MLAPVLLRYLNHKLKLAGISTWYKQPDKKQAIDWAYGIQQLLRFKGRELSDRDVAQIVLPHAHNLEKLLPCPSNKSYESSVTNVEKIKKELREIFKPKTASK
jgi:hypothetical protein